jgi:hypothetical protein
MASIRLVLASPLAKLFALEVWSFITDHFSGLKLSDEGNASHAMFVRMAHSRSPPLHTILKDCTDEGDTTSSGGRSSDFPSLKSVTW